MTLYLRFKRQFTEKRFWIIILVSDKNVYNGGVSDAVRIYWLWQYGKRHDERHY